MLEDDAEPAFTMNSCEDAGHHSGRSAARTLCSLSHRVLQLLTGSGASAKISRNAFRDNDNSTEGGVSVPTPAVRCWLLSNAISPKKSPSLRTLQGALGCHVRCPCSLELAAHDANKICHRDRLHARSRAFREIVRNQEDFTWVLSKITLSALFTSTSRKRTSSISADASQRHDGPTVRR